MTKLSYEQLTKRFGGSALLVKREYLFVAPLAIMSSLLVNTETLGFETYLWLVANLVALAACALWLLLFDKVFFARRHISPVGFAWVVAFAISLGALKGAMTGVMAVMLELESSLLQAISSRVTQTSFMGLCLVLGITVIESTRRKFQEQRDSFVATAVRQKLAEVVSTEGQTGNDDIRQFVQIAREKLSVPDSESGDHQALRAAYSTALRELVENNLRPLSHRLWQIENAKYLNFTITDLSRLAIKSRQSFIWQVAGVIFAGSWLSLVSQIDAEAAFIRSALEAVFVAVVLAATKLVQPQSMLFSWLYFLVSNAAAATAAVMGTGFVLGRLPSLPEFGTTVVVFFWLCQLTYFTRMTAAALDSHRLISENARPDSHHLLQNRELANYLHSNLQNRLLSAAIKIERGEGGITEMLAELAVVENVLNSANADFGARNTGKLPARLEELRQRWAGFVEIEIQVGDVGKLVEGQVCDQIMQIVSEGVSNSVRHGMAAKVHVLIAPKAAGFEVTLEDDGLGLRSGVSGLGSKFFDSIAGPNGWSLTNLAEGGTRLAVSLS